MVVKGDEKSIHQAFWVSEDELIIGHGTSPAAWKKEVQRQVNEYFKKERNQFNLPLSPQGTEFQKMVWAQIRSIPFGTTKYYCDVLRGDHTQAVVGTTGANPILLLIPCHRLIRSDGDLTGYSGGLDRKEKLLELEGAHLAQQLSLF